MNLLGILIFMCIQAGISCKWINDAQRFILEHFDTIHNSPSHLYAYALPFSPPSSWLHKHYRAGLSHGVRIVKGNLAEWGACFRTVSLNGVPSSLAYWKNTIAVGLKSGSISILDSITGSHVAVLSGQTDWVMSLTFSLDGVFIVSGGDDKNVTLWDVQTGGVVKTFCGHTDCVLSVSITPDCTTIASGSMDMTINLWHVQAGERFCIIDAFNSHINSVSFSPTNPHLLISASGDNTVQQWDTSGVQIGPTHNGSHIAFSLDGVQLILCQGEDILVQNSNSGEIVAKFHVANSKASHCCFSPDGRLVAVVVATSTIYIWDTTTPDQHPIQTLVGHTSTITSLAFLSPSSLVSSSLDQSVKFWQIGAPPTDPAMANPEFPPLAKAPIKSITLQRKDGIVLSSDSDGVVKTWDIFTGLCKASFHTQATGSHRRDVRQIDNRIILVWQVDTKIHILDVEQADLLQTVNTPGQRVIDLWISGDGAKVFCLCKESIQAWSILTGEMVGGVTFQDHLQPDSLTVGGAIVWVHFVNSPPQGWDFGIPGEPPTPLSNLSPNKPRLDITDGTEGEGTSGTRIKNAATGHEFFQLSGRFAEPCVTQCDHQYLAAGYESGEVVILDFDHMLPQ